MVVQDPRLRAKAGPSRSVDPPPPAGARGGARPRPAPRAPRARAAIKAEANPAGAIVNGAKNLAPKVPPIVPYVLAVLGVYVAYSAIRNVSPWGELQAIISGRPRPKKVINAGVGSIIGAPNALAFTPSGSASFSTAGLQSPTASNGGVPAGYGPGFVPKNLVAIGQGSHRLVAPALADFQGWQAAYGAPIILTDSWRSYDAQARGYASAPNRFGDPTNPTTARHVLGEAVDVNLSAMNANPRGNATQVANWNRLYSTALANGWANPGGPNNHTAASGHVEEDWHFETVRRYT